MRLKMVFLCMFFLIQQIGHSQQRIQLITINGLNRTKLTFVESFITSKEGNVLDSLLVEKDVQELQNLQLFYSVKFEIKDTLGGVELVYKLKEVVTQLPIVGLGWTNDLFWSELGVLDLNALGKGINVFVKHRYYQRNSYSFFLRNPHFHSSRWGYELNINRLATIEPLYFKRSTQYYNYNNTSSGFGLLYWLFKKNSITFYTQYIYESYQKIKGMNDVFNEGPDRHQTNKLLFKFFNISNYINYEGIRLNGVYNYFGIETIRSRNVDERFFKISNEFKVFKFINKRDNMAFRLRTGVATNRETPFAPFVADNYVNLRGVGDRTIRGTAEISINLEYRRFLMKRNRVAVSYVGFIDSGSLRAPGAKLSTIFKPQNIAVFSGIGVRIHLLKIYNAILRLDYSQGVHKFNQNGFIVGFGQYF